MISLTLSAEVNGITDLRPTDTPDQPFYYTFTVQCTSCREVHDRPVSVSRFESTPNPHNARSTANLILKCRFCSRTNTLSILEATPSAPNPRSFAPLPSASDAKRTTGGGGGGGKKGGGAGPSDAQSILTLDTRGLELVAFHGDAGGTWEAAGTDSGTKFSGIELTEDSDSKDSKDSGGGSGGGGGGGGGEEWYDYDEKAGGEVWVRDCVWGFRGGGS